MEYRLLGTTGARVSAFALGSGSFGAWGNADGDECVRMIDAALDAGINLIDTADIYSLGGAEEIVGRALRGRRDRVILATKATLPIGEAPNRRGSSRLWLMQAVEESLRRLGTDYIDLYQMHQPDPDTAIEETLATLTDLVRQGKVRYIGSSNFQAWQLTAAQWASERRGLARFVSEQPPYSIVNRGIERDLLPAAQRFGLGVLVWSPLGGGLLTGKYRLGTPAAPESRAVRLRRSRLGETVDPTHDANREKFALVEQLQQVARDAGLELAQMALAFTLAHPAVSAAIIGPRTAEQLTATLAGADLRLDEATLDAIDAIVAPGRIVDEGDRGWTPPWLQAALLRRTA